MLQTIRRSNYSAFPGSVSPLILNLWMPSSICNEIESSVKHFIWSKNNNNHGWYLVNWNQVTKAKANVGLEVRRAREVNVSLLTKLTWKEMLMQGWEPAPLSKGVSSCLRVWNRLGFNDSTSFWTNNVSRSSFSYGELNVDGGCVPRKHVGGGGVIRGADKVWMSKFSSYYRLVSWLEVELLAFLDGLRLA
ncbi:hypothetical protein RJT34_23016 [Clitoria ternatea]|uniref:Uncharacterized protein n=1 Tax=Clitoria ternatea TaxID=43366 RepID=A0AAN9FRB0_CLITE